MKKLKSFFNLHTYQQIQEYNNNQLNGNENGFYSANLDNYEEYVNDPHSVAGCLKSFFRELPEPLFVFAVYDDLVKCASISNINERLTALWNIVNSMPKSHIENLKYLIKFFSKLAANSEVNKMSPQNLSIAIAPSLIWAPPATCSDTGNSSPSSTGANPMTYGLDMCSANQYGIIIETMIIYSDWFFPGNIDFDSLKNKCPLRKDSVKESSNLNRTPQPPMPRSNSQQSSQQNSPRAQSKSVFSQFTNNPPKERNPLPTPRQSTIRSKKPPAPPIPPISKALNQSNGNQNGLNLSSQNLSFNNDQTSNFITNSTFFANQNSYNIFQTDSKMMNSQNDLPTLKSFERKGSFQNDSYNQIQPKPLTKKTNKDATSSSSSGTSTSNSQDSVNSLNTNTIIESNQNQKKLNKAKSNNCSKDSLLSNNTEPNYQNLEHLSSSSSENLDLREQLTSTPRNNKSKKLNKINQTSNSSPFNATYGSLDRHQLRQVPIERSRQINQHRTSSSFISQPTRSGSKNNRLERPNSIPPEPPLKPFKPRSHDDLLTDSKSFDNDDRSNADKKFNLKLDVKGKNYDEEEPTMNNVSYVKLEGNEVKFTNQPQNQIEIEQDNGKVNFNNNVLDNEQQFKLPVKPKRNSPPPRPPPSLPASQISKSLMNEHTYL